MVNQETVVKTTADLTAGLIGPLIVPRQDDVRCFWDFLFVRIKRVHLAFGCDHHFHLIAFYLHRSSL